MTPQPPPPRLGMPVVERACQLARSGMTISEIRAALRLEGYSFIEIGSHLGSSTFLATLRGLAVAAVKPDEGRNDKRRDPVKDRAQK
jgi:hypothetical protein